MVLLSTVTTTSFQPRCWYSFFLWTPPLSLTFASAPSSWWRLNTAVLRDLSVRLLHFEWKHAAAGMLLKRLASAHCWERHASSSQVANVASGGAAVNVPSVHQWLSYLRWCQPSLLEEEAWRFSGGLRGVKSRQIQTHPVVQTSRPLFFFFFGGGLVLLMMWTFSLLAVLSCPIPDGICARPLWVASSWECRWVFVLFCPIIIQTISLPCFLPLQGAEGTQPLLCLLFSSYILLGSFSFYLLPPPPFFCFFQTL